jgi:hypothetical protein
MALFSIGVIDIDRQKSPHFAASREKLQKRAHFASHILGYDPMSLIYCEISCVLYVVARRLFIELEEL